MRLVPAASARQRFPKPPAGHRLRLTVCVSVSVIPTAVKAAQPDWFASFETLSTPSAGTLRYNHDTGTAAISLDQTSGPLYNLYQSSLAASSGQYSHDNTNNFYSTPQVYSAIDYRPRLNGSVAPTSGMAAHAHTGSSLPHPNGPLSVRERYSGDTPGHKRMHQTPRSPAYCTTGVRRHDMPSMTATPTLNVSLSSSRNDRLGSTNDNMSHSTPPLLELETLGTIMCNGQTIKPDIGGTIDKGFFLSDNEWTCYRRNYFSTICHFSLSPLPQPQSSIFFCTTKSPADQYQVYGWAMSISAIVSENTHAIELVQHTPKRDKGPTHPPEKIPMTPKLPHNHHHGLGVYGDPNRASYPDNFGNPSQPSAPCVEHSFERIQFKQATQNNGKRRAAQQYYHLVVELYADVGGQKKDRYVRVAFRKSAQMIVRGRSPGHYSTDRRGSQSSGANNQSLGPYQVMPEYTTNPLVVGPGAFTATYDARTHAHNNLRHNDVPAEHPLTAEDEKAIDSAHRYMYFPDAGMNASQADRVDLMNARADNETMGSRANTASDHKVKPEFDYMPRQFTHPVISADRSRCGPFEGKTTSNGYYPNMLSQSGVNFSVV